MAVKIPTTRPTFRPPSSADRPPVSRVGDELQRRIDQADWKDVATIEAEAWDAAMHKGWDHSLLD